MAKVRTAVLAMVVLIGGGCGEPEGVQPGGTGGSLALQTTTGPDCPMGVFEVSDADDIRVDFAGLSTNAAGEPVTPLDEYVTFWLRNLNLTSDDAVALCASDELWHSEGPPMAPGVRVEEGTTIAVVPRASMSSDGYADFLWIFDSRAGCTPCQAVLLNTAGSPVTEVSL